MKALFLAGRVILGGFFLHSGITHFKEKEKKGMAQGAGAKNVPNPEAAVLASGALLAAGGASLILGMKPKFGALSLITFLAIVSPIMHDFWNSDDANEKQQQLIHFSKNMALLGAALSLAGVEEPWPLSLGK